jgi:8-oxo-dGTP pyrophosphatase MutT (NUDIX family)
MSGKYPNTFYRVSIKAIIRNDKNEVLVVKEKGSAWSFPGGGMDHGEAIHDALKRELYEEVLITSPFTETIVGTEAVFVESKDTWLLCLVCDVVVDGLTYGIGEDADDVAFIDPITLKNSTSRSERLVYKFATSGQ